MAPPPNLPFLALASRQRLGNRVPVSCCCRRSFPRGSQINRRTRNLHAPSAHVGVSSYTRECIEVCLCAQYVHFSSSPQKRKPPDTAYGRPVQGGKLGKARGREVPARDSGRESRQTPRPPAREEAWRPANRNCTGGRPTAAAREVSRDRRPNGRFQCRLGKRSHSEPRGRTTVSEKDAPPPQNLVIPERKRHRLATGTTRKVRKSRSGLLRG